MPEFTMDQAMGALDPHFDDLDRVCRTGLETYHRIPGEFKVEHSRRAQAACVYDHMVAGAERTLSQKPGVVFKEFKGLKVWIIADTATVRFKKMDEDGRSRNYPTVQTRTFDRQLPLPGFPLPPLNLVVGYWPDVTETQVLRVQVARPMGKTIDWCGANIPAAERGIGGARWIDVTRQARAI